MIKSDRTGYLEARRQPSNLGRVNIKASTCDAGTTLLSVSIILEEFQFAVFRVLILSVLPNQMFNCFNIYVTVTCVC